MGLKCGKGTYLYKDCNSKYSGDWERNLRNGYGKFFFDNGDVFEGFWKDGREHGEGCLTW